MEQDEGSYFVSPLFDASDSFETKMKAGYSKTSLEKKLGIKAGMQILLYDPPVHYFDLFDDFPDQVIPMTQIENGNADFIHLFCTGFDELKQVLERYSKAMKKNGALWISWPKGSSQLPTELNRDLIRETVLKIGLVDIKVAAIDRDWSGLKFVHRLKNRDKH